jgi:heat shock protein HslJ
MRLLVILAIALTSAGCSGGAPSSGPPRGAVGQLTGTSWIVVTVDGRSPVAGAVPTLAFTADRIQGFFGCNQGGGTYRLDPATGQFAVSDLAETAMGCLQPGVMEFEAVLVQALGAATRAGLDDTGRLLLAGPGGAVTLAPLEHPAAS